MIVPKVKKFNRTWEGGGNTGQNRGIQPSLGFVSFGTPKFCLELFKYWNVTLIVAFVQWFLSRKVFQQFSRKVKNEFYNKKFRSILN